MVAEQQAVDYTIQIASAILQISVVGYSVLLAGVGRFIADSNNVPKNDLAVVISFSTLILNALVMSVAVVVIQYVTSSFVTTLAYFGILSVLLVTAINVAIGRKIEGWRMVAIITILYSANAFPFAIFFSTQMQYM